MCSSSTPCWSATEAMQSFSHFELRKLGVMMENFMAFLIKRPRAKMMFCGTERLTLSFAVTIRKF